MEQHLRLQASQLRESSTVPGHPLNKHIYRSPEQRKMKSPIFNSNYPLTISICQNYNPNPSEKSRHHKSIHTQITEQYIQAIPPNNVLDEQAPEVSAVECDQPRGVRRRLAQLRARKSPFLTSYMAERLLGGEEDVTCKLCGEEPHDTRNLFRCREMATDLEPKHLWTEPMRTAELLERWSRALEDIGDQTP